MAKFATVQDLDKHLASRSYVTGYCLSGADKDALAALKSAPCASAQPHAYRWALHISALTGKRYSMNPFLFLNCQYAPFYLLLILVKVRRSFMSLSLHHNLTELTFNLLLI